MKILVTGGNGLLASEIKKKITTEEVLFCDVDVLDITNIDSIRAYVNGYSDIDVIINCAAGRDADIMEEDADFGQKIAVDGPRNLALVANEIGATLVHISSDYVFDGKKSFPYTEEDETNGLSVYGRTKALGEQVVLNTANTGVVFRTAWLLSLEGKKSFVKTIANLAQTKNELGIVFDQVGSPTCAADLAEMILKIIPKIQKGTREIFNLTNEGVCSWYDIAQAIVTGLNLPCKVKPIHSYEYPTKAKRPTYSVLDKTKVKKTFDIEIRHYSEGLNECINQLKNL